MFSFFEPNRVRALLNVALGLFVALLVGSSIEAAPSLNPPTSEARFLGAEVDGLDLHVRVAWDETFPKGEWVLLDVAGVDGESLVSQWVQPLPGKTTVTPLAGVLVDATARHPHHEATLRDAEGNSRAEPYAMQARLECDDATQCRFQMDGGVSAPGMLKVSSNMADALAEAEAAGASDLLAHVATHHPGLIGDVYTMAWQMAVLQETTEPVEGCYCHWTVVVVEEDSHCDNKCGASHSLYVSRGGNDHAEVQEDIDGTSSMTLDLDCWAMGEASLHSVSLDDGSSLDVPGWTAAPCQVECGGLVTYTGKYTLGLDTTTGSTQDASIVLDTVAFQVGSNQLFSHQFPLASGGGLDDDDSSFVAQSTPAAPGTTAEMTSSVDISVFFTQGPPPPFTLPTAPSAAAAMPKWGTIGQDPPVSGAASGFSHSTYRIEAAVQSVCTGSQSYLASTTSQADGNKSGGVGDDISILVGKCDG